MQSHRQPVRPDREGCHPSCVSCMRQRQAADWVHSLPTVLVRWVRLFHSLPPERGRPSQLSTRGSRGAIQVPLTSGRACGRRLSLIWIGLGDEPVFLFACTEACFLSGPLSQLLSASAPVIVMAALYIITHSFPSSMHIFGAAFPLTRAVRRPFSFPFLPSPA